MAVADVGKQDGERCAELMSGRTVAVMSFKPDRVIPWEYSQEFP